ncbi:MULTISPECIES: cob(I)yrinic acid a,c-diamide adenosyltransferase [Brevibacillus]|uniref:Corrinoid adenosyltransferase n=1 Tax=Brevibacillus thermoruber TaxID=33942 RepID=A0A9X3TSJ6_9BACL|nr:MULTISPECIES: cob(I)yrinic acid a,c-diamide adenosyltransferase [Brevibacillus]MDA5110076.1 cob(I)yrinic acid a,c-diamide adenosyltransferase [Brevibacillus thermoruber]TRY25385.1 cob(I)yrinic acid a,c-diamide adenosyltransferase [Brevibacillus sp. LEMMJ03]UYZ12932.1 cob(I)yrinic acid a,c-diamide adenosyltransferase [Brevibacillus sp. WF146]
MKIYTKSGDKGETSLVSGVRVPKHADRVEAYGTCDEANSAIGLALSLLPDGEAWNELRGVFHVVQTKLFHIGAELATPEGKPVGWPIRDEDVQFLEEEIDKLDATLPPLSNFILPGGHPAAAAFHVARTVVRRAERKAVLVSRQEQVNGAVVKYLNRLSDYLFVVARWVNRETGRAEQHLHEQGTD